MGVVYIYPGGRVAVVGGIVGVVGGAYHGSTSIVAVVGGIVAVVGSSGTVTGGNTLVGIEGVGGTKLVGTDVGGGIVVIAVWWITGRVIVVVNGVGPGTTV
jgi:hypothetical protein